MRIRLNSDLSEQKILTDLPVIIETNEVLRYQGYTSSRGNISDSLKAIINEGIEEGYKLVEAKSIYQIIPVELAEPAEEHHEEKGIQDSINNDRFVLIPNFRDNVENIEYIALFISTIGLKLENNVSRLFENGEYTKAVILDSVGTAAVENVMDNVNQIICKRAVQMGLKSSRRVSPGYGGWDIKEQKKIFSLLKPDEIGISLTDYNVMVPKKTVTALIAMAKDIHSNSSLSLCNSCDYNKCRYAMP